MPFTFKNRKFNVIYSTPLFNLKSSQHKAQAVAQL
jgi:hypothetical protein